MVKVKNNLPIIELNHIYYRYDRENVLEDVSLRIDKGAFLGIVGPNGSGKSTLLKLILGLIKPQKGDIKLFGEEIRNFRDQQKIGFVSQKANSFNSGFPATVYEVVASGLTKKMGLFRFLKKQDAEIIVKAIKSVGMEPFINRNIGELSGGQQQRVFIARALVSEPELLILDEPTVGVDAQNVRSFYEMLGDLNKRLGITLMLVTHDIGTITDKVTHVACLNKHLHFHGNTHEFEEQNKNGLAAFYGYDLHLLNHDHSHDHGHDHNHGGKFS